MSKKYLVTGGAGFIGSHLCKKLLESGHDVLCMDNFYNGSLNNIRGLFNHDKFHFVEDSVLNLESLKELSSGCDHIFHLAAQIHVEKSIIRPTETMEINLNGTKNLLDICTQNKNISMTLASSAEVYGEGYHSEDSPLNPQSPYAASKVAAEGLCIAYNHTYGTNVRVVRNFNTFGPKQRSSGYGSVISIFIHRALSNKPLIIYGDGQQTRDYQYIDDAVNGYLVAEEIPSGEVVNTGFGEDHKIIDIARMVIELTNSNSSIVHADPRPGEVLKLRSNVDKIRDFGHSPKFPLKEGLSDFISWNVKYDLESLGIMR